jgi:superfamily I DNA and/or RNA helicase
MASPHTVAQIFPRLPLFDVIVFDEASQCKLEEALPVLTRGHRVVIAGDPKQLPPTRFFESAFVESEVAEAETDQELFEQQQGETEDLLSAGLNLQVQQCYLDVHYRSGTRR